MEDPNPTEATPHRRRLLLLSGFMGVGKSTIGRALAELTGASLLDLDDVIEAEAGQSIPSLFAQRGEAGFRELERAALKACLMASPRAAPSIVALGGGALLDPRSRDEALARAFVVTLHAEAATIVARCEGSDRPLLAPDPLSPDPQREAPDERVRRLLEARAPIYRVGHLHLDTESRPPAALARELANRWAPA